MQQYLTIRDGQRGTRQDCTGAPCTDEWITLVKEEEVKAVSILE